MPSFEPFSFDPTAFMSGQVLSKLWLAEQLEKDAEFLWAERPIRIFVLGGWYCMTNFLLHSRGKLAIEKTISFDVDPKATEGARILNETSIYQGKFEAHTVDVNTLDFTAYGAPPDVVINTSTEHMSDTTWFENIPKGTWTILQSTNMPDDDHHYGVNTLGELEAKYPLRMSRSRTKKIHYETWSFERFMTAGKR